MPLTKEDVAHVAHLARLKLSDSELETMQHQLSNILSYIDKLSEVDVEGVPLTAQVTDLVNVMRDDTIRPSMPVDEALANAPRQSQNMFRVKAIFDENNS
ncbi:Asp-tRNA(Asn)/Glu-tRNA(Gln) amidotransferase subunit GatC [Chloroflexia bacterium SDU3-3]|nr:Asp-tRNA(Asn)/Glu-tRNA(Gln) amidotransferase subunit GatC [Chloroflexia bacterium SDU3-3]